MADEYWALGDDPAFWDKTTLGGTLTGITFSIGSNPGTVYKKFTQITSTDSIRLRVDGDTNLIIAVKSLITGVFSYTGGQSTRAITVHSIEPGSTAYEWMKSATGGKGVKYDFMQDLASLNPTNYSKLSTSSDSTTKITAKANGYAPNSNTATWRKGF